jgi:hypothetical protein
MHEQFKLRIHFVNVVDYADLMGSVHFAGL